MRNCGECGQETGAKNTLHYGRPLCGACKRAHQWRVRLQDSLEITSKAHAAQTGCDPYDTERADAGRAQCSECKAAWSFKDDES